MARSNVLCIIDFAPKHIRRKKIGDLTAWDVKWLEEFAEIDRIISRTSAAIHADLKIGLQKKRDRGFCIGDLYCTNQPTQGSVCESCQLKQATYRENAKREDKPTRKHSNYYERKLLRKQAKEKK